MFKSSSLISQLVEAVVYSLSVFVLHEDNEELLEQNDGVKEYSQTTIDGIINRSCLSIMNDLLDVIKDKGAK